MTFHTARFGRALQCYLTAVLLAFGIFGMPAHGTIVTWTGSGGNNWANTSWSVAGGPGTADTASFTDTGSVSLPGTVTSVLNVSRSVGGLAFSDTSGHYHTLDLGGFTLTDTGTLSFNLDQGSSTISTIRDGALIVSGSFANISVGLGVSGSSNTSVDLSGLNSLSGTLQNVYVGVSSSGSATGTLTLSPSNNINAQLIQVGASNNSSDTNGTLKLGLSNTIISPEFDISQNNSTGTVSIVNGGSLNLGSSSSRTLLQIGTLSNQTNNVYSGSLTLTGATLAGYLSSLIVGQSNGTAGVGGTQGTLIAGTGTIDIGGSGNSANIYVGRALSETSANGIVDFSSMSSLNANINTLAIGTSLNGSASGTMSLAASNTINALNIIVGSAGNSSNTLNLGAANQILTNQLTIAQNNSGGNVTLPAGGSLTLGSSTQLTGLTIAYGDVATNNTYAGSLNMSAGSFTGYLSSVIVGQMDNGGAGGSTGNLIGGTSGTITIGAAGTNTANFIVANQLNNFGASAAGTVNFGGETRLTANLNNFTIGTATQGNAIGTVTLAASNVINANSIVIGDNGNNGDSLTLGHSNAIVTNQFTIGQNNCSATVTVPSGGTLNLGTNANPTALVVGTNVVSNPNSFSGKFDLTGTTFNAYLSELIVGQRDVGSGGTESGTISGASGGTVTVGTSGNSADVYVGRSLGGGAPAAGTVDFSGLGSFSANLNTLSVGTSQSGSSQGTLLLASSNNINATNLIVGQSGGNTDTLGLGQNNIILANQFTIGQDYSNGLVTIPSGGSLALGSAAAPVNLSIAVGTTNTNNTYGGTLNLTNATLTAYLGNVIIGQKDTQPGSESGTFTISNNPSNYILANSITLGGNQSTGTLNYGGGQLFANSIAKGTGTANFNWTAGTLSTVTFGTSSIPFNLNNSGSGTLATGNSAGAIGTTTIYGNYTQGGSATTAIRISGDTPSTGNDQVAITGSASLNGSLNLSLTNNFEPSVGQSYLIETYGSRTGTYSFVQPPSLPQNVAFQLDYSSPTQLYVRMVNPVVQNYIATAATGNFGTAAGYDTGTAPATYNAVSINNASSGAQNVNVANSTTVHSIVIAGSSSPLNFQIPQGVTLAVANQLTVDNGATVTGGGKILGNVVVNGGTLAGNGVIGNASSVVNIAGSSSPLSRGNISAGLPGSTIGELSLASSAANTSIGGSGGSAESPTLSNYLWQMNDAGNSLPAGTDGSTAATQNQKGSSGGIGSTPGAGWDNLNVAGLTIGENAEVDVVPTSLDVSNFNPKAAYSWPIVTDSLNSASENAALAHLFTLDTSATQSFLSNMESTSGGSGSGFLAIGSDANDVVVDFVPTPEPGSSLLITVGLSSIIGLRRRRTACDLSRC